MSCKESAWSGWWRVPVSPVCGGRIALHSASHQTAQQPRTSAVLGQISCGESEAQRLAYVQVVCSGAGMHTWVAGPARLPSSLSAPSSLFSHITWTLGGCGGVIMRPHGNPLPPQPFSLIPECSHDALNVRLLMTVIWRQEE